MSRGQRARFSVPGCSCGSQGDGHGLPPSAGVVFGPWLLVWQPGRFTVSRSWRECFSVPGCSRGSQEGLPHPVLGRHGFLSLAALRSSKGRYVLPFPSPFFFNYCYILTIYLGSLAACAAARGVLGVLRSAGAVYGPWLLVWQPGRFTVSLRVARRASFSVHGCSRGSQEGLRHPVLGRHGFLSLAPCAWQARFSVPGCIAKQPGKVGPPFPFPLSFVYYYILTIYLGSLAACAALAAREIYGVPRSAGLFFSPWLLVQQPGRSTVSVDRQVTFFGPWLLTQQPGGSTVSCARQAPFSVPGFFAKQPGKVCPPFPFPLFFHLLLYTNYILWLPGCLRGSQGGLRCPTLGGGGLWSLAARAAAREVYGVPRWALFSSVPGCSCSSRGGLRYPSLGRRVFRSLAARGAASRVYGTLCSAGTVSCSWLLCEAAGKVIPPFPFPPFFVYYYILALTIYLGSLAACAAARQVLGVPRSAGAVFSPCLLARQPGGSMASPAQPAWFSVPGCFGEQPRRVYGVTRSAGVVFFFLSVFHVHRQLFNRSK